MEHYIGIDIGGTFTDCAVLDRDGRIVATAKAPSTREDPAEGVLDAIRVAADSLETTLDGLLSGCRHLIHGCTIATNAVVERNGVSTGLITTKGHEDAIPIGKVMQKVAGQSEREMIHQSHLDKADPPIVDRRMIRGVAERLDRAGDVVVAMDVEEAARAVDALVADGARAIAVCFLWSFLNGEHERRVRERIERDHPDVYVSTSSELAPVLGEYERAVTTVVNAYVGPRVVDYLERLAADLNERGYRAPLLLAHSMGGLTTMEDVRARPLLMLDSGPVSGVLGARFFGAAYGEDNILCADMGGTTFDVAMIEGGKSVLDEQPVIDKYAYLMPKVAVSSVGAGGGSVVWLDENGLLRVGPDSAGADPGPACYGRGGTRLTVTDVDLILGFLDASAFLGGRMRLDIAAAERAADELAGAMGNDRMSVASGAFRIVNAHMADLMRRCSIDRGRDPREFVLFAYGGAAAMHIAYLARELRIGTVYVPSFAAVFSALGMMTGGLLHGEEASFPAVFPAGRRGVGKARRPVRGERARPGGAVRQRGRARRRAPLRALALHEIPAPAIGALGPGFRRGLRRTRPSTRSRRATPRSTAPTRPIARPGSRSSSAGSRAWRKPWPRRSRRSTPTPMPTRRRRAPARARSSSPRPARRGMRRSMTARS